MNSAIGVEAFLQPQRKVGGDHFCCVPLKHDTNAEVTHALPTPMHGSPVSGFHPNGSRPVFRFVE